MKPETHRYLTAFCEFVSREGAGLKAPTAGNEIYVSFPMSICGAEGDFQTRVRVNRERNLVEVRLAITGANKESRHKALVGRAEELKSLISENIKFDGTRKIVFAVRVLKEVDLANEADWPQQHAWLLANVQRFLEVFPPIIATIVAEESGSEDE